MPRRREILRRVLLALGALLVAVVFVVGCCTPQLATFFITPRKEFAVADVPPAPDYRLDRAWLALPTTQDEADVALPDLPAVSFGEALVDVFFVHSTSSVAPRWNAPIDDKEVRAASIRGGTLIQASVFSGCCAVYAPQYRQASGSAFTHPTMSGEQAISIAYSDVKVAFQEFQRRTGGRRPFIIAGHSQGAAMLARLLREEIAGSAIQQRLVAAYLPGAPVSAQDLGGVPACTRNDEVGCVVTYNARGPDHKPSELDFVVRRQEDLVCVNPTLGKQGDEAVPTSAHGGAVFFDAQVPAVLPAFVASRCQGGLLVVSEMQPLPKRGLLDDIAVSLVPFHAIEYQLFYVDLRRDAARRVAAALHPSDH